MIDDRLSLRDTNEPFFLTILVSTLTFLQAKDALATIDGRLSGTLLGVRSAPSLPLSVEGHVQRLVTEAMDKENLGRMYIWWMPW